MEGGRAGVEGDEWAGSLERSNVRCKPAGTGWLAPPRSLASPRNMGGWVAAAQVAAPAPSLPLVACPGQTRRLVPCAPARSSQVLSPMRKGPAGTTALNPMLQALLNPPAPGKAELARHQGQAGAPAAPAAPGCRRTRACTRATACASSALRSAAVSSSTLTAASRTQCMSCAAASPHPSIFCSEHSSPNAFCVTATQGGGHGGTAPWSVSLPWLRGHNAGGLPARDRPALERSACPRGAQPARPPAPSSCPLSFASAVHSRAAPMSLPAAAASSFRLGSTAISSPSCRRASSGEVSRPAGLLCVEPQTHGGRAGRRPPAGSARPDAVSRGRRGLASGVSTKQSARARPLHGWWPSPPRAQRRWAAAGGGWTAAPAPAPRAGAPSPPAQQAGRGGWHSAPMGWVVHSHPPTPSQAVGRHESRTGAATANSTITAVTAAPSPAHRRRRPPSRRAGGRP